MDADADAPRPWMATLCIPGEDLGTRSRLSASRGRGTPGAGAVHHDLKPANAMPTEAGPRLIDFGVSHAAESTAPTP